MSDKPHPPPAMKSYLTSGLGLGRRLREALDLYRLHSGNVRQRAAFAIERMDEARAQIEAQLGAPLRDQHILDVGPGQLLRHMTYLSRDNRVTGIDLDQIVQGLNPLQWARIARQNGPLRAFKTVGRKLLGLDARFQREFARQLGLRRIPRHNVVQGDAACMPFADAAFDCVFCKSVFQHLPEPRRVLDEIIRVLKPGGVSYISVHLYTSPDGGHTTPIAAQGPEHWWKHIRESTAASARSTLYTNRLRLDEWRRMFALLQPGHAEHAHRCDNSAAPRLAELRAAGELVGLTDDELLTVDLAFVWRKPG